MCLNHLTPQQIRAFRIADNRLTEISTWDDQLLATQLKELSVHGLDFNIEVTGFEMGEIDLRIASLDQPPERDDDPADALPTVTDGPAVSTLGDLWLLGHHRVLCGNALEAAAFAALLDEDRAAAVFTDPPYNVATDGHASGLGAVHHRPFPMASGEMDSTQFTDFLAAALRNLAAFSSDGSVHFVCMDWRHIEELLAAGRGVYGEMKNLCVWVKDNAGMGSLYRSQHELVFVFKHGRADHPTMSSAAAMCWRSPIWSWPRGSSCSVSRREFSLSLWPGRCSASAWPWDFMIRYLPTLTGLYGRTARRPITGITLIAGFASTVGWPLSAFLDAQFGWRAACLIWAALHILIGLPLNRLLIPVAPPPMRASEIEGEVSPAPRGAMATLAFVFATTWFVTGAMAAHPPRLLEIAGASTTGAIAAAALVGPAQVAARLVEFGALRRVLRWCRCGSPPCCIQSGR